MPPKANAGSNPASTNANNAPRRGGGQQQATRKPPVGAATTAAAPAPATDRNKVVVRRCPPDLPEAVFWQSVQPWIQEDAADWKLYLQGRTHPYGSSKETANSVAYIHFKRQEQMATFAAAYQGHTFRDAKGNRFQVIVQYAPFQKIPPKKVKPDPLSGTIDDDADYQSFVQRLNEPEEPKLTSLPEASVSTKGIKKTTPLLDELRRKKQENTRKKLEDSKQSRSAKRAAARAAASSGAAGASTTKNVGAKLNAAEAKALKKAEREKRKKADRNKKDAAKGESSMPPSSSSAPPLPAAGSKSGQGAPSTLEQGQKPMKGNLAKKKAQAAAAKPPPPPPPKMTILAPPKANSVKKETQLASEPNTNAESPAVTTQSAPKLATTPTVKPKPMSSFDDIVGQFAKQMKTKPVARAATTNAGTTNKAKQSPENTKTGQLSSSTQAPGPTSPPLEGAPGCGRGRGGAPSQRGRRNASGAGRGTSLSPAVAPPATPAPS